MKRNCGFCETFALYLALASTMLLASFVLSGCSQHPTDPVAAPTPAPTATPVPTVTPVPVQMDEVERIYRDDVRIEFPVSYKGEYFKGIELHNGAVMVPLRALGNARGQQVEWVKALRRVLLDKVPVKPSEPLTLLSGRSYLSKSEIEYLVGGKVIYSRADSTTSSMEIIPKGDA